MSWVTRLTACADRLLASWVSSSAAADLARADAARRCCARRGWLR
jgi:hypothetical protein